MQLFKLNKGTLRKFGYTSHSLANKRHLALKKASGILGSSSVIHKLNAIRVLNKNINPILSKKFKNDMIWVQKNLKK